MVISAYATILRKVLNVCACELPLLSWCCVLCLARATLLAAQIEARMSNFLLGVKRCRVEAEKFVVLDWKDLKFPIMLDAQKGDFDFYCVIMKGSAWVGIVGKDADLTDIKYSDTKAPKYGYFVRLSLGDAVDHSKLQLFGQDGTCQKESTLTNRTNRLLLSCKRKPSMELRAKTNNTKDTVYVALEFDSVIPDGQYKPCVVLDKNSVLAVTATKEPPKRRRITAERSTMQTLWIKRSFADATFVCEDQKFEVHRCIVGCLSPVLSAALGSSMVEATTKEIKVEDASPEGLRELLRFAYTGDFKQNLASAILPLAMRYQVSSLSERCAKILLVGSYASICKICQRPRQKQHFSKKMWDKRSLTPKDLTCIDCQSPLCKAVGCKTCKTCRNSTCKSRGKCSKHLFIPYPKPKDKAAVEAFLCAQCSWTTCACGKKMTAKMKKRRNKDRNNERYVCMTCRQKVVDVVLT